MILPDYPIDKKEQDLLRRLPLSTKVASLISEFSGKESFVIGVEGKWGSGKTSFINLVLGQLNKKKTICFTFNPWNFSDETSLLRDFFVKFSEVIEQITGKKASEKMRDYADKLSDVDLGFSYAGATFNPFRLLKFFVKDSSLEIIREELNKTLAGINKKIVVVIDDIDRLDKKETMLVLKLVKLTADFPKTIFVLAYDRNRVEDRITELENGLEGNEYLKKIIQVSFSLPLPDQQELWNLLSKDLDATLAIIYGKSDLSDKEQTRWNELFFSGFNNLFWSIRDIKRYVSSLRLDWTIMGKDDVNKIDFLGIEAIRVFAPRFYEAIPANREVFIESREHLSGFRSNQNEADIAMRQKYEELLKNLISDEQIRKHIDGVCKQLFPYLEQYFLGNDTENWERDLRICSQERFQFYFQLGIPYGEISENQMEKVIQSLDNRDAFKAFVLQSKNDKRLQRFLSKLILRLDTLDSSKSETALSVFWELEKQIDYEREGVFELDDVRSQVMRFGLNAIKRIPTEEKETILKKVYTETQTLYYPARLLAIIDDESVKAIAHSTEPILNKTLIDVLKAIMVQKIESATSDGSLKDEKLLRHLLYWWKNWKSAKAVTDFIQNLISTREGLMIFLKSFVGKVLSTGGNYNNIAKNSIAEFYPIEEIEKLVGAITEEEFGKMSEEDKEAIGLFKNPKKE